MRQRKGIVAAVRRRQRDEQGIAMVIVIGVSSVLAILLVALTAVAISSHRTARHTQDWDGALAAAYAGVEDYKSRLANDTTYFQYGNPASSFSTGSSVTLPTGAATNPAFGLGETGTWAKVPGSTDGWFRYEVDSATYYSSGRLRIRATGKVGTETRSLVADLKQQGFIDFLYFTDYEIQDPQFSGDAATCVKYAWAGRGSGCSEIAFGNSDRVDGPVHSNDTIRICNATFVKRVETGLTTAPYYAKKDSNGSSCSNQQFLETGNPQWAATMPMPATNTALKQETRSDLATVTRPGCLYTGPTSITFNSNGSMTVRSPWTKFTNTAGDPASSGTNPAYCGTPGTGGLGSSSGQTITVPASSVIYVQNVPTSTRDPNYSAATPGGITVSSGANGSNGIGYPMAREVTPVGATSTYPAYGYKNGDLFVQGALKGQVTLAAENYVYVTGDTTYTDTSEDLLGLIGQNGVFVWNPVSSSGSSLLSGSGREIDAAILSVAHTFQVQNYSTGSYRGDLTVFGAISQKFRGVVYNSGYGNAHGYTKKYSYDTKLTYTAPPKYLTPTTTTYGVTTWAEVHPAFTSTGAASS